MVSTGTGDNKCYIKQGYKEGSSWSAYQITDTLFFGGMLQNMITQSITKNIKDNFTGSKLINRLENAAVNASKLVTKVSIECSVVECSVV